MTIRISIDCMGGDRGPAVTVAAAVSFVKRTEDVQLILVGQEIVIAADYDNLARAVGALEKRVAELETAVRKHVEWCDAENVFVPYDSDGGRLAFLAEQAKLAFLNFGIRKQLAS